MMRIVKILTFTAFLALGINSAAFAAYIVDGNLSDWGINLNDPNAQFVNYLDTHLPTSPTADAGTEDNADINSGPSFYVGPSDTLNNIYDAEAIYLDNDMNYLYIAVVTGLAPSEAIYPAGDIFVDIGKYQDPLAPLFNTTRYQFGVDVLTGKLYSTTSWENPAGVSEAAPWKMGATKTFISDVDFIYTANAVNSHYVMETRIPLAFLSLSGQTQHDVWAHWTMKCDNDYIKVHGDVDAVPEPATMSLMLLGGAGMGFIRRKSKV